MAALDFPDSPSNGDEFSGYVYDSAKGVWNRLPTLPALDLVAFSATAPSSPQDGQFWFDTTSSKMYVYYNDGSSSQWVSALGGLAGQTGADGQFLIHNGTEWVASNFTSPGSILQVVSTAKTDTFSVALANGAFSSNVTGLEATLTPTSTLSKVLVTVAISITRSDERPIGFMRLMRDATPIGIGDASGSRARLSHGFFSADVNGSNVSQHTFQFLDSPATTSATTYGVQLYGFGAFTFLVNRGNVDPDTNNGHRTVSTITAMEVAG